LKAPLRKNSTCDQQQLISALGVLRTVIVQYHDPKD